MTAPGAFERAMLEAFRPLFHGSGYHPRLTLGAARTTDQQELWISCFPHAHPSQRANWRRNSVSRGRRNQNRVALADEGRLDDTTFDRRYHSNSAAGLSRLKELTSFTD